MPKRRILTRAIEADVLMRSRRRCCLCAYLNGDFREKQGQIAHVDRNIENGTPANLIFLCFDHHDRYDSSTRQSKNLTTTEVVRYRNKLWKWSEELDDFGSLKSQRSKSTLDIPWAFEMFYPSVQLLFRISPRIYDVLPHHDPDIVSLDKSIENPVHAAQRCFQVLESYYVGEPRITEIPEDTYLQSSVVQPCRACNNALPELGEMIGKQVGATYEASILMWSLKSGVYKDVRRLITLETPLVGRIKLEDWKQLRPSLRITVYFAPRKPKASRS
jgi:hypothetical protein